ncbi:MAG: bifunctional folylpolyglutamate synthase/dihydrofolate synthase [Ignavibacterium sp.]|nr:bifunctional folylpolyglutamate synthase/dihydrofolate synthase [Ignavibacterium sp.]
MEIKTALEKLFSLHSFGIKLGLENIQKFLDRIGNPQNKLKVFHIAGSNGKGSTASFIASILTQAGYKVGLYTSPHFVKFNERVIVDKNYINDEFICDFLSRYEKLIDEHKLTFFEVTTAMAFEYFLSKKVNYAVIETGLGGRLDATNVIQKPLACIITSISLEHTNILGDKISLIAKEKGGIIKDNSKVFVGKLPKDADEVIEKICVEKNATLIRLEDYLIEKNDKVELYSEEIDLEDWTIPLQGKYQRYNAALATLTVAKTLFIDDPKVIYDGLKNVVKNTLIQGRYEIVSTMPKIILDSAHNPGGIHAFITEFLSEKNKYDESILLFSALKDKDIVSMVKIIDKTFDKVFITDINYERKEEPENIKRIFKENGIESEIIFNKKEFLSDYLKEKSNKCLVITGSMYLLGEIKSILQEINFNSLNN